MTEWTFIGFDPDVRPTADFVGSDMDREIGRVLGLAALPEYRLPAGILTPTEYTFTGFDPEGGITADFGSVATEAEGRFYRVMEISDIEEFGWPIYYVADDHGVYSAKVVLDGFPAVPGTDVQVNYSVVGGSAIAGQEYNLPASPLVIPYGDLEGFIDITVVADGSFKKQRDLSIRIDSIVGADVGIWNQFDLYIRSRHAPPVARVTSASQSHPENGGPTTVTVELDRPSRDEVRVPFTVGGTAGSETYAIVPSNGELVYTPGQTSKNITITPVDDGVPLGNRTIVIDLALLDPPPIPITSAIWPTGGTFWNSPQNRVAYSEFFVKETNNLNSAWQGPLTEEPGEGANRPTNWVVGCVDGIPGVAAPYELQWVDDDPAVVRYDGSQGAYYAYIYQEAADEAIAKGHNLPGGCIRHSFKGQYVGVPVQLGAGTVEPINIIRMAISKPPAGYLSTDVHSLRYYNRFPNPPWFGDGNSEATTPHGAAWEWVSDGSGGYIPQLFSTLNLTGPNDYAIILGELGNGWWEIEVRYDGVPGEDIGNISNTFFKIYDTNDAQFHPLEGGLVDRFMVTHDPQYGADQGAYQPRGISAIPGADGGTTDLNALFYVPRGGATNHPTENTHELTITDDEGGNPMEAWLVLGGKNTYGSNPGPIDDGAGRPDEPDGSVWQLSRGIDASPFYVEGSAGDIIPARHPFQDNMPSMPDHVGPALEFGRAIHTATGKEILLVPCVIRDGTVTGGEWRTPNGAGYLDALAQAQTAIQTHGATLGGWIFMAGNADDNPSGSANYENRLHSLIRQLRSQTVNDANGGHSEKPFIIAPGPTLWWQSGDSERAAVDYVIRRLADVMEYSGVAATDDIGDDPSETDTINLYAGPCRTLGPRFQAQIAAAESNTALIPTAFIQSGSGQIVDAMGNAFTLSGTIPPVVFPDPEGLRGDVIRFTGAFVDNDDCGINFTSLLVSATRYSIEGWFRKENQAGVRAIMGNTPNSSGWIFGVNDAGVVDVDDPGYYGHDGAVSNDAGLFIGDPPGAWTHLAFVFSGTNFTIYKNGALVGSTTTGASTIAGDRSVTVGNWRGLAGWHGHMDFVRLYNQVALNADQVDYLYNLSL